MKIITSALLLLASVAVASATKNEDPGLLGGPSDGFKDQVMDAKKKYPPRGNSTGQRLPEDLSIDCQDMITSLDNIMVNLLSEETSFNGNVYSAGDGKTYKDAALQYATARVTTAPSFIIEATNQAEVQASIIFASACGHKVSTRSGGHSYVGSSSCDGSITSCIQLDVSNLNHVDVTENQVSVGPGVKLDELYPVLIEHNIFLPAGECSRVAVGGHLQTGGFGKFNRQFGRFNSYVSSFDIVLADGSLVTVTSPKDGVTSKRNDELWHAVLGGASGSFGVIVEARFDAIPEDNHHAFYWEVNFLYNDDTKECLRNMLKEYAEKLEDEAFRNDPKWNIYFNLISFKELLAQQLGHFEALAFNHVRFDLSYVAASSSDKAATFADASAIYTDLLNAYRSGGDSCILLDEYFDALSQYDPITELKHKFPSRYASATDSKTLSQLTRDVVLFPWQDLGLEASGVPFKSSYQQGSTFPSSAELIDIFDHIDALVPADPSESGEPEPPRVLVAEIITLPGAHHANEAVAQPFQDDVFGVTLDIWSLDYTTDYGPYMREAQDVVIASFDGEDHRMLGFAYEEDTCLECGAWEKYYNSRPAFNKLTQIKRFVDPDNVFKFRMSMPTNPINENELKTSYQLF